MQHPPIKIQKAFSLVELLIVLAVLAILITFTLTGMSQLTDFRNKTSCLSHLKHLHAAISNYANDHNNCFPAAYGKTATSSYNMAWSVRIEAYLPNSPSNIGGRLRGITYCPATKENHEDLLFRRDAATWRTDYAVSNIVMTNTEAKNVRSRYPGSAVLLFDAGGGAPASQSQGEGTARRRHQHRTAFNAVFVDGHAETLSSFQNLHSAWKVSY